MSIALIAGNWNTNGNKTATAGTVISHVVPPKQGMRAVLTELTYESGATGHTVTVLKALAKTNTSAAAASGATTLALNAATFASQTIAANDFIVVEQADGNFGLYKVSALSTLTVTIPALSAAVALGAQVWIMGAIGEAEHGAFKPTASARTQYASAVAGISSSGYGPVTYSSTVYRRSGYGDPIVLQSDNATNAGFLYAAGVYRK